MERPENEAPTPQAHSAFDSQPQRTAILVLGMHRSGTSALTRVISLLGADLPSNLMPAVPDNNATGFWESMDVYELNDELLHSAGSSWDDWRQFNSDWYGSPVEAGFLLRALDFIDRDFSASPFFVLKDPRISRILPFWLQVMRQRNIAPKCVISVRNPLEVASSLRERDGFSSPKSLLLWLRHMLDAELATRSVPRSFVAYDGLLADWRKSAMMAAEALDLHWPAMSAKTELAVDEFLGDRMRHHRHQADDLYANPMVTVWVKSAYAAFLDLCRGEQASDSLLDELDKLRSEFDRASQALGAVVYESEAAEAAAAQRAADLEEDRSELRSAIEQEKTRIAELEGHLDATHTKATEVGRVLEMRDRRVRELEQSLMDTHGKAADLGRTLEERSLRVRELERGLAEAHAKIADVAGTLGMRDARLQTLGQELEAARAGLKEFDRQLEQRDQQISKLEAELGATHEKAADVGRTLELRDRWVADLRHELEALKCERQQQQELNRALNFDRDEQARLYHESRAQQCQLLHSLSEEHAGAVWQIMRPLRAVESRFPRTLRVAAALPKTLWWAVSMQLPDRLRRRRSARALLSSGLFDESWYVESYPDVIRAGYRPIVHWVLYGWREGRNPNRLFDTAWYLSQNPSVAELGVDPLLHYIDEGVAEGLNPHPGFDSRWYLQQNPEVARSGLNPLRHFLAWGEAEGRAPAPSVGPMPEPVTIESLDTVAQMAPRSPVALVSVPNDASVSVRPVPVVVGDGESGSSTLGSNPLISVQGSVPPWNGDWATLVPLTSERPRRILVVDWKTPTPDLDSGSYRITKLLKCLVDSGLSVDFVADRAAEAPRYATDLLRSGVNLIVGYEAAIEHLIHHGSSYRAAILSRPEVAERYLAIVRAFAIQAKVIYDTVDLHWVRFARSVKDAGAPAELTALSGRYKRLELANARAADVTVAITEEERQLLLSEDADLAVSIIPNIHESVADVAPFETRHDLFFIGGFDHAPNVDAMHYFVEQVMPLIVRELNSIKLYIVGSKMPDSIKALGSDNVDPVGFVEDVRPYFERSRVFVAPLRHGAGMKGKVGQSLSFGLPVVTTPVGAEGIGLESGKNAFVSDTAEEFAAQVLLLYGDQRLWEQFSRAGRELISERFSEAVVRERILELLKE